MLLKKLSAFAIVGFCTMAVLFAPTQRAHAQEGPPPQLVPRPDSVPTPEDPDNLAKEGYSPADIKDLYGVRRRDKITNEARLWTMQGKYPEAIAQLQAVLKETRINPGALLGLAEAYAASGDIKRAIDAYQDILISENHPAFDSFVESDPRYMEALAILLHKTGNYDEAWAWHQKAQRRMNEHHVSNTDLLKTIPLNTQTARTAQFPFVAHLIISTYDLRPSQAIGHLYLGYALVEQARFVNMAAALAKMGKPIQYADTLLSTKKTADELREEARAEFAIALQTGSEDGKAAAEKSKSGY